MGVERVEARRVAVEDVGEPVVDGAQGDRVVGLVVVDPDAEAQALYRLACSIDESVST